MTIISDDTHDVWFAFCVWILNGIAEMLGMTYNAVNIWIFCIIGPAIFFVLCILLLRQTVIAGKYQLLYKAAITSKGSSPSV